MAFDDARGFDPGSFWERFAAERHRLANFADARARGEDPGPDPVALLNEWLGAYDEEVHADLSITEFGRRLLILAGPNEASLAQLMYAAPSFTGWRYRCELDRAA